MTETRDAGSCSAQSVAEFFLPLHKEDDAEAMSQLRLQKLLYYAQAWHLALTGRPLIDEDIQAWRHGPAVPSVYRRYKSYGWRSIPKPDTPVPSFDPETARVLHAVWNA